MLHSSSFLCKLGIASFSYAHKCTDDFNMRTEKYGVRYIYHLLALTSSHLKFSIYETIGFTAYLYAQYFFVFFNKFHQPAQFISMLPKTLCVHLLLNTKWELNCLRNTHTSDRISQSITHIPSHIPLLFSMQTNFSEHHRGGSLPSTY